MTEATRLAPAERVIEYEVAEHPWASEEGCLCPAPVRVVRATHEQAASARAEETPFAAQAVTR